MFETIKNAWRLPDLRKRIIFTLAMFLVFRLGAFIPVPYIDRDALGKVIQDLAMLGFFDVVAGGTFKNMSIFAMSVTPYINSSIIMTLLTIAIPALEELSKQGEEGKKKIAEWTRYGTAILAFIQAAGIWFGLKNASGLTNGVPVITAEGQGFMGFITITFALTAGTVFLMWLGEQITENGVGNGISLLIFAGIISRIPNGAASLWNYVAKINEFSLMSIFGVVLFLIMALAIIVFIIIIQEGERRIPVQYAKRVVGRRVYGGQSTHLPIKVNIAGVIPIIFAISLVMLPTTIAQFFPNTGFYRFIKANFSSGSFWYSLFYALFIIGFTYFYTAIVFNPVEISNNLKQNGGFIPGIRPGRPTVEFITKVLGRITLAGALFLAFIAILPTFIGLIFKGQINVYFGGTSLLIVVGVALETVRQIEAQMLMRHYKGFLS
ncbi:preprotein translocase subunit SecY [Caldicellulosiruptoraceae bacterium PP1]